MHFFYKLLLLGFLGVDLRRLGNPRSWCHLPSALCTREVCSTLRSVHCGCRELQDNRRRRSEHPGASLWRKGWNVLGSQGTWKARDSCLRASGWGGGGAGRKVSGWLRVLAMCVLTGSWSESVPPGDGSAGALGCGLCWVTRP